jgi:hypothetical protein
MVPWPQMVRRSKNQRTLIQHSKRYSTTYILYLTDAISKMKLSIDETARVVGSGMVIIGYFIVLHVNTFAGVVFHIVGDGLAVPYFIRTKSWDVVIMIGFLEVISFSKILTL